MGDQSSGGVTVVLLACVAVTLLGTGCCERVVQVTWMVPASYSVHNASASKGALALGILTVRNLDLLPNHSFNVTWLDSSCDAQLSIGRLVDLIPIIPIDVIIGPPCSQALAPVAELASYRDIPVISWVSNDQSYSKARYSTLLRVMPPLRTMGTLLVLFFQRMRWYRVALISTTDAVSSTTATSVRDLLEQDEMFHLIRHSKLEATFDQSKVVSVLKQLTTEARIVIIVMPEEMVRPFMLEAHDQGLSDGEYQFVRAEATIPDLDRLQRLQSTQSWKKGDGRDSDARQAFESLIYFTYSYVTDWALDVNETSAAVDTVFSNRSDIPPISSGPDKFSAFLHDAVELYGYALNGSNGNSSGRAIFDAAVNASFYGRTGTVLMADDGDRHPSFLAWDLAPNGTFSVVFYLYWVRNATATSQVVQP